MININFNNSSYDTLPPVLRTFTNFQWVQVLIKPLKDCYDTFTNYVFNNDFELKHNSQTLKFNDYLNTKVPTSRTPCYIADGEWALMTDMVFLWFEVEIDNPDKRLYLDFQSESIVDNPFIGFQIEYDTDSYDFVIWFDILSLTDNSEYLNELIVWIDTLRIIGTTYRFQVI